MVSASLGYSYIPPCRAPAPLQVSSAFSQLLNLHNVTEESITARVEKAARLGEVRALCVLCHLCLCCPLSPPPEGRGVPPLAAVRLVHSLLCLLRLALNTAGCSYPAA